MMKRLLLSSTALVAGGLLAAPAMAADPIKMGVGGYYTFFAVAGNIEGSYALNGQSTQYKGLSFYQEGEIYFTGQTKLDNGTSIGVTVELEGWNPPVQGVVVSTGSGAQNVNGGTRQIDEAYIFAFGDWGRVEMGSRDQATYRMYYGTPSPFNSFSAPGGFFQHNSNATYGNLVVLGTNKAAGAISFMTIGGQMQDVNRINYFTPRFMGLQIGAGYAPKINISGSVPGSNTAGVCGYSDASAVMNCPTNDYSWQDFFDIGANYLNKFGDVTVALFGAWDYATFVPGFNQNAGAANMITGFNLTNLTQWTVGAQFGWNGFTVGGSYGYDNNGVGANYYTGVDNANRKYSAGIMYETGPWQVGFAWAYVWNPSGNGSGFLQNISNTQVATVGGATSTNAAFGTNPNTGALSFGAETANKFELSGTYALGPGVKAAGGLQFYNFSGPSNAVAAQSWAALLGMVLQF
jgi:outer membrane protein OmpU